MSESILQATEAQEEHNHDKERLQTENANLIKLCAETEVKYELKRLALIVVEANVISVQEST